MGIKHFSIYIRKVVQHKYRMVVSVKSFQLLLLTSNIQDLFVLYVMPARQMEKSVSQGINKSIVSPILETRQL